ncbi:hypothetical protein H6G27_34110 [Nostoc linckia FACHB-104]|nr:hypothetical protein [Nostoc linckia FACHB-104]
MPPGLAAGSQTCNAQATGDDSDDLTKSKKLVIYRIYARNSKICTASLILL